MGVIKKLDGYRLFTCYICGNYWEFGGVSTCKCIKKMPPKMPKLKSGWYKLDLSLSKLLKDLTRYES
jgi:hypothetical protein